MQQWHFGEPVAVVNAARLVALAGMAFGLHLTMPQLIASCLALEAVLTLFTRNAVSPTSPPSVVASGVSSVQPIAVVAPAPAEAPKP